MFNIFQNILNPNRFVEGYNKSGGSSFRIGDNAIDFGPLNPFVAGAAEMLYLSPTYKDDSDDTPAAASTATDDTPPSDDDTDVSLDPAEEERKRMDAIRRMLAGRYGRAETNLTMGRSFGEGSGRSLTGMS